MVIRYTRPAAQQLDAILDYIANQSPRGAGKVLDRIEESLALITAQPLIGRATSRPGFRRFHLHPYPYAILYRSGTSGIVIHAIRHTARRPSRI